MKYGVEFGWIIPFALSVGQLKLFSQTLFSCALELSAPLTKIDSPTSSCLGWVNM